MRREGARRVFRSGPATVQRACGNCGREFTCLRGSVADQLTLCLRCFQRKMRFPGLCQRP